jgi:copper chaperone NosL
MKHLRPLTRILVAVSSLSLTTAYFVPLWQILMWAPQYPEGLEMKIWIDTLSGDVKIISALNHYIGMRIIEVSMFPEFNYMIYIVGAIIGIGLLAALWNRIAGLLIFLASIVGVGIGALIDFWMWGYDYGHNLNPDAAIKIEGMSYQPPLIGTKVLLNFTAFSGPDIGGWLFIGVALLLTTLLVMEFRTNKKNGI